MTHEEASPLDKMTIHAYEVVQDWRLRDGRLSFEAFGRLWQFVLQVNNVTGGRNTYYNAILIGANSHASFTVGDHEISGLIMEGRRMYFIEQIKHASLIPDREKHDPETIVMYSVADVETGDLGVHCSMIEAPEDVEEGHRTREISERAPRGPKRLAVYIDNLYNPNQGPDVAGLIADVNTVYKNSNVPQFIDIFYGGSVGYSSSTDIITALSTFRNWVAQRRSAHARFDNVHLLTGRPYGFGGTGGAVGVAYSGTTCRYATGEATDLKTGLSALMPRTRFNRPSMIQVIAHELGHNRTPPLPQPCPQGDCAHDRAGGGCFVMAPSLCDTRGGVVFRPTWAARMC